MAAAPQPPQPGQDIDSIVTEHMGLVGHVVRRLIHTGFLRIADRDDAMQEGFFGLRAAAKMYDFERPWPPFAALCIKRKVIQKVGRERARVQQLTESLRMMFAVREVIEPDTGDHEPDEACRRTWLKPGCDPTREGPEKSSDQLDERIEHVRVALSKLSPDDSALLCARYGLQGYRIRTLSSLAESMKVPINTVRERERAAMNKLRKALAEIKP